jgi:phosphoribosylaminoimidazole-succinocarboxamide synthase
MTTNKNTSQAIHSLKLLHKGKVRDSYIIDDKHLLMVTSDRLSAFDVILGEPIPNKGNVLNQMALFWFDKLNHITPNHLTGIDPATVVANDEFDLVKGRAVVVQRLKPILVEAVVRGYLSGSGWKEYQETCGVCGEKLPHGLKNSQKLEHPIFTPAAKAKFGDHDENISFNTMQNIIGVDLANKIKQISIEIYTQARDFALTKGIIIADTKFEFGLDEHNNLILMDEILTPDSSRFWDANTYDTSYANGNNPASFDKQFVRDWLEHQVWNKQAPAPTLPHNIIEKTAAKYRDAFKLITGKDITL